MRWRTKERFARVGTEGLPGRRWIALDLRAFGDSVQSPPWTIPQYAEDVLATLDALGIEQADVFGTSLEEASPSPWRGSRPHGSGRWSR